MSDHNTSDLLDQLTLGKTTEYANKYNASLLDTVPRSLTRETLDLTEQALPFIGHDYWTGYEISWLNMKGKPQVVIGEFVFDCDTDVLIESKSFKLYLNSFNQSQFNNIEEVQSILTADLSHASGKPVTVKLYSLQDYQSKGVTELDAETLDDLDIEITQYDYAPELLKLSGDNTVTETLKSDLLKSNCLVTGQPDWGSIFIEYTGPQIDKSSLLQYLISFRGHNEFHEHCVERVFVDLQRLLKPEKLTVFARYTRRGGLDINPLRSSHTTNMPWHRLARQ